MAEKVRVEVRPITYVIGIIAVVLVVTFGGFLALFSFGGNLWELTSEGWTKGWFTDIMFVFFWPLIFSVITVLITENGRGLSKQELTLIISMVGVSWIIPTHFGIIPLITLLGTARSIPAFHKWWFDYGGVNNWMFGPDPTNPKLWDSFLYGGPVPWDAWMPAIAIWLFRILPYYLSFVFLAALWRRQWIEIEALPFPYATANASLINMAYERDEKRVPRILTNKFLWSGVIVGFFAILPFWAPTVLPGLGLSKLVAPDQLGVDLTPLALIPWAPLNFHFEAFWIGALFLVPTTTLFSLVVVAFISKFLWPVIMVPLGVWDPMPAGFPSYNLGYTVDLMWGGLGPLTRTNWMPFWGAPMWFSFGAVLALMFYPLFIFRDDVINMIKATFGKVKPEVEEKEPLKYRYLWAGYITCIVLYSIAWWYTSLGNVNLVFVWIWMIFAGWFYGIGVARTSAEMGQPVATHPVNYGHNFNYNVKVWWLADPASPFFIRDLKTRYLAMRADLHYCGEVIGGNPCPFTFEAFKLGSLTGLHSKHIFLGAIIAVVVGVITTWFTFLPMFTSFGATRLSEFGYTGSMPGHPQRGPTYACITEVGNYWRAAHQPAATNYITSAIGAATIVVMYILRARFAWFPLNPAGVAMGSGWAFVYPIFFPAVIAYASKIIILRVGGLPLYEKKAMPFAIGLAVALSFAIILTNLRAATLPR